LIGISRAIEKLLKKDERMAIPAAAAVSMFAPTPW